MLHRARSMLTRHKGYSLLEQRGRGHQFGEANGRWALSDGAPLPHVQDTLFENGLMMKELIIPAHEVEPLAYVAIADAISVTTWLTFQFDLESGCYSLF